MLLEGLAENSTGKSFAYTIYNLSFRRLDEEWGYKMFWGVSSSVVFVLVVVLNFGRI